MSRIGIGLDTARRLQRVIRRDEMRPYDARRDSRPFDSPIEVHRVQITSTTQTAGRYPGTLYSYDADTDVSTVLGTAGEIWVDTPNGETLTTSKYYYAKLAGVRSADSRLIFQVVNVPGSVGRAIVRSPSPASVANTTTTTIDWLAEVEDTDDWHSTVSNPSRITAPTAGLYLAHCQFVWAASASGDRSVQISFSGGTTSGLYVPGTTAGLGQTHSVSHVHTMSAGEYAEVIVYQNSGAALSIGNGTDRFSLVQLQ